MSLLPVGFGASGDDYEITDSLRFRRASTTSLNRTPASSSNRKTWTYSAWVKLGNFEWHTLFAAGDYASSATRDTEWISITDAGKLFWGYAKRVSGTYTTQSYVYSEAVFRDPSAWYHFVIVKDVSNTTTADKVIFYVNGVRQEVDVTSAVVDTDGRVNDSAAEHKIGVIDGAYGGGWSDGYITEVNFIDGQALVADDFGEFDDNGTWKAKEYTGTYGTNGFYLPMKPTTQAELQNTVLYAGNTNEQSIDGVGYAPDFVWIKNRTGANNHYLYDTVRGTDRALQSQSTSAESVGAQQLTSFDTDGFTVPYDVSGYNNYAGRSYVAWTWDAGDNQTSTGISSVLYVGQGVAQSVKGFGFSPDLILFKNRASASPLLIDSVRGPSQELQTNSTSAETSNGVTRIKSIDSDGFTLADTTVSSLNTQNNNYVAWGWDAGDGDPVSNTDGSITSTVKASDATGFSIVSYTGNGTSGATIGHGLSSTPKMIIVKNRTTAGADWPVYHEETGNTGATYLNTTAGFATDSTRWNNTSPTSTVFSVGNGQGVNHSSASLIAYCFSEVSGVSKIDSYTGNGSTTGPVITTGFRPGFLLVKKTSGTAAWQLIDGTRDPFANPASQVLYPNLSDAEYTWSGGAWNFTSTGFQPTRGDADFNGSGETYIYIAFKGSYSDYVSPLNTDGDIDSRVKANTSKGFSIVSYTGNGTNGATVGHGLSSTPEAVIVKDINNANNWAVYHKDLTSVNYSLVLNDTAAQVDYGSSFIAPASSTLSLANGSQLNASSRAYIAYCFHSVTGYSKIGLYQNNNSTSGVTVTTGFRPAFIILKCTDAAERWFILDNARQVNNVSPPSTAWLVPNDTAAEGANGATTATIDFLDNGFQIKTTDPSTGEVSFGTRSYIYMAFADTTNARFNFDASGNKNNWLPNNINSNGESESTYDLMKDTPSLVDENAGNFATFNPLAKTSSASTSNANLTGTTNTSTTEMILSTVGVSSGKWYWEVTPTSITSGGCMIGIRSTAAGVLANNFVSSTDGFGYYTTGNKYSPGVSASYGASYTTNDIIGVALDMDAGTLTFYKNNVSQGTAFTSISGTYTPGISNGGATSGCTVQINFGQRPFAYTPPTGFKKLNTFNLPDSTIEKGDDYFNTVLWTGNTTTNGVQQAITGVGFQPDFVWAKTRNQSFSHYLYDSVRGVGSSGKLLQSNNTNAEATNVEMDSFDADGFTVEYGSTQVLNWSSSNNVGWNWLAGNSTSTSTAGSVNSTVSVSTTAGFSVVGFTAPSGTGNFTAGHGLGVTPSMVIVKTRDSSSAPWYVWNKNFSNLTDDYMRLNATNAKQTQTSGWGAGMTSSVIGLKAGSTTVATENHIAYCFAEVEGYSSFGSYTGNGTSDGPFVYTGFRPSFVIIKETTNTGSWVMLDTTRSTYNVINNASLWADLSSAEGGSASYFDMLSNGFKIRDTDSDKNTSGETYIYMAFAENPFKNALAR